MLKFLCKTLPFYIISWCMLHKVWKLIKLTFQRIQRHVIWKFQGGVIAKKLKTAQEIISWNPFHVVYLIFFISCFHLFRRAVPNINTPLLHIILRLLIIKIQNPFVQLCANKPLRVISTPLLLWFPSRDYTSGGFIRSQLVLLLPLRFPRLIVGCVGWFLWECGWANPRFRLPVKDGGWLRVLFARLH